MNIISKLLLSAVLLGAMSEPTFAMKPTREDATVWPSEDPTKSYTEEEVSFVNPRVSWVKLFGTLRIPTTATPNNPAPVVLFIGGSGPMNREILDQCKSLGLPDLYTDLAEYLADQGIASLIVDKRGYGKSTGRADWIEMTWLSIIMAILTNLPGVINLISDIYVYLPKSEIGGAGIIDVTSLPI